MRKNFALLMCVCMLLTVVPGAVLGETEKVTLTVLTTENSYSAASLTDYLPVWQKLEEITGVHIEFEVYPSDSYETIVSTRLGAGVDLPDIIDLSCSNSEAYQYGVDGLLIPLNDLLDQYGENFKKTLEEKPALAGLMTGPDGTIYFLSSTRDEEMASGPFGWVIRKDWLDKLGLEEPVTLDDWYNVLKAFKEKDPNGNGIADEVPMTNYHGLSYMMEWSGVWGLHLLQSGGFYPDAEGKVQYEFIDDRALEMVKWLNKLYTEGLYDMETFTNTRSQFTARMSGDISGAAIGWQETTSTWNGALKSSGVENAHWVLAPIPTLEGYDHLTETAGLANSLVGITKNCKNPEAAIKWLDYVMYSRDSARLMTLGIEGQTYNVVDGKEVMTDFITHNPDGLGPVEALRSLGGWQYFPFRLYSEYVTLLKMSDPEHVERAKAYIPFIVPKFEVGIATEDEMDTISRKLIDINTYQEEMYTKFILGEEPLDNWGKFVDQIKGMGIDEVLTVYQAQYDRTK